MKMTKEELILAEPLMKCCNATEFKQRLQWLSEGMLQNHLKGVIAYVPSSREVELYKQYKGKANETI